MPFVPFIMAVIPFPLTLMSVVFGVWYDKDNSNCEPLDWLVVWNFAFIMDCFDHTQYEEKTYITYPIAALITIFVFLPIGLIFASIASVLLATLGTLVVWAIMVIYLLRVIKTVLTL